VTEWDAHGLGEPLASVALIRGHLELGYTYQTVQTVEVNRLYRLGESPKPPVVGGLSASVWGKSPAL